MKYLYLLLSLISLIAHGQCDKPDNYRVASIEGGSVKFRKTLAPIKTKSKALSLANVDYIFEPEDKVTMTLISPTCGEMRIFQPARWNDKVVEVLVNYFGWRSARRATGVRGGAEAYFTEIQQRFSVSDNPQQPNTLFVLGSSARYAIDSTVFPQTNTAFFAVTYQYKQATVTKKLPYIGNQLQIDAETIYRADGRLINLQEARNMALSYVREPASGRRSEVFICAFRPYFETDPDRIRYYQNLQK